MTETYVIDGTNVCWWFGQSHPDELSIQPLVSVLVAILENGDDFYCVFDASTPHVLDEEGKKDQAAQITSLLKKQPKRFFMVTGSTRADGVILHDADANNRRIITNDIYRDYRDRYAWLSDKHTPRLIQGNLHPSGLLTVEKLSYGHLRLVADVQAAVDRIYELLEHQGSPVSAGKAKSRAQKAPTSRTAKRGTKPADERTCIKKASAALMVFLEPFGDDVVDEIKFEGSSWESAVKKLSLFFDTHVVCTHCYYTEARCYTGPTDCENCGKGEMTCYREEIWDIVNRFAPKNKAELVNEVKLEKQKEEKKWKRKKAKEEKKANFCSPNFLPGVLLEEEKKVEKSWWDDLCDIAEAVHKENTDFLGNTLDSEY